MFGATALASSTSVANRTLVVADASSGERLIELAVDSGDEVTIAYVHSVQRTPVEDVYVVDGTELRAERSVFHSFGAGLPSEDVERTDEGYVVAGRKSHEELHVTPGEIAGHELVVDGERYDLVAAGAGRIVLFVEARGLDDAISGRLSGASIVGSIHWSDAVDGPDTVDGSDAVEFQTDQSVREGYPIEMDGSNP